MNYEALCSANPALSIHRIDSEAFRAYGRLHIVEQAQEIMQLALEAVDTPQSGNVYVPDVPQLTRHLAVQALAAKVYGGLAVQAGVCAGTNTVLNGIEFHQGNETLVAAEDCVLILGEMKDMHAGCYDTKNVAYFYMAKGQVAELYSTTLHYTPCRVGKAFCTVVILLQGTNLPLQGIKPQGLLSKTNKWFITHETMSEKIAQGAFVGLVGEIPAVKPLV